MRIRTALALARAQRTVVAGGPGLALRQPLSFKVTGVAWSHKPAWVCLMSFASAQAPLFCLASGTAERARILTSPNGASVGMSATRKLAL